MELNRLMYDPGCSGDNGFDADNGSRLFQETFSFPIKQNKKKADENGTDIRNNPIAWFRC